MEPDLSIISIILLRKRILSEIKILIKNNICVESDIKINKNNNTGTGYLIEFKNSIDNKHYKFIISNNYPFSPPTVFINEKSIMLNHYSKNTEFRKSLKKYTGIDCFCCETILCSNNWNPADTFTSVLKDIDKFRNARR